MKTDKETSETASDLEETTYNTFPTKPEQPYTSKVLPLVILVLSCIGVFCEAFCYENPTPFQTQIEKSLSLSTTKYNMLFSFYYLPNIIAPLLFGYLADSCGRRLAFMLSASLIVCGQLLFAVGITTKSYGASITGRLLFGVGAEAYVVVVLECLSFWTFSFIAISMGINSASQRLGSALNDFMLPRIYESTGKLALQFWIGLAFAGVCILATIILVTIECYSLRNHNRPQGESMNFSAILNFPLLYWVLTIFISFVYMGMISFNTVASGLLQTRFHFSVSASGVVLCIPLVVVISGNILFGFLIDRIGRYSLCALLGSVGLAASFIVLSFLPNSTPPWSIYLWFAFYGVFCSLVITSVWPCIKFVVPQGLTSTAFGLCFSIEDAILFLGPFLTGLTIDGTKSNSGGYFWSAVLFFGICVVATGLSVLLFVIDYGREKLLYDRDAVARIDGGS